MSSNPSLQQEKEEKSRTSSDNNPQSGNKQLTIHTKKQQSSLEFLALVKELLDRAKYKLFTVVMRKYRAKTIDNPSMCREVLEIFADQATLLDGFERFLPEKQRDYWRNLVTEKPKDGTIGATEVKELKSSAEDTSTTVITTKTVAVNIAEGPNKIGDSVLVKPVTLVEGQTERNKELISTREIKPRASEVMTSSNSAISTPERGIKRKVNELLTSDDELQSSPSHKDYPHKKMKLVDENKIIQITDTSSLDTDTELQARPKPALPDVLQISDELKPAKTPEKREMMSPKSRVIYDLVTGLPTKSAKKPKLHKSGPMSDNTNNESQHGEVISLEDSDGQARPAMIKSASDISSVRNSKEEPVEQGPQCPICLSKLKEPFISVKCGHMCCYLCWLQWFKTKLECPVCRERTREKNLKKVFFYM
jgi:hypothetical protein